MNRLAGRRRDLTHLPVVANLEWMDAGAPSDLYWFENPTWTRRYIGQIRNALKDIGLDDFDDDGRLDIIAGSIRRVDPRTPSLEGTVGP
jgi:hypothetical protein